jgi:hypothetical protein
MFTYCIFRLFVIPLFSDARPVFTNVIANITAPKERDVTFTCNVKNLGHYNVRLF